MTITQIYAVLALLGAFNVPVATVDEIRSILLKQEPPRVQTVYTGSDVMPEPTQECVENVTITSFSISEANNEGGKIVALVMRGLAKCSNEFDVEYTSTMPIAGSENYSGKARIKSNIKTQDGYTVSKTFAWLHVPGSGPYTFTVKVLKDGIELAKKEIVWPQE